MKISLNWLRDFVDFKEKNAHKLKDIITTNMAEVETMETIGGHLDKVIVGKIEQILPHPNADKLRIAMVSNGHHVLKVVCGGSNLKEGMKVALAELGAVVRWHGTEVVKMEKAKIRGEESFGMICAAEEIGLSEMFPKKEEKEIVDLSHIDAPIGTPLAKALGLEDTVLDIDNHAITHRADLFSHRGFAREFVAAGLAKWKKFRISNFEFRISNHSPAPIEIKIQEPELCANYLGVYITGIEVKESPDWLKKRLSACGVRPLANIIDITNYVMLELGMPIHAFDLDQMKGKKWTMRRSRAGEKVVTLDQKEIELVDDVTVLDDGSEIFDLCGIMGGFNSGINIKTHRIWLHAPVYNPTLIRRAMRNLAQITEAGIIYEKGVDSELAYDGLKRASELILELCPNARIASKTIEIRPKKPLKRILTLSIKNLERLIGTLVPTKDIKRILEDLGFKTAKIKGGFKVTVPSWRLGDIEWEADIIEEVARVHGYDKIPAVLPQKEIRPISINHRRILEREIKDKLVSLGFNELYTFAFVGPELLAKCEMKPDHESIEIENPISSDMSLMRQSLLPRILEAIANNLRYKKHFRAFELNRTFHKKGDNTDEKYALVIASVGEGFRELQGVMENLGYILKPHAASSLKPWQHPGRCAELMARGQKSGIIYELHPQVERKFDLKTKVMIAEIDLDFDKTIEMRESPKLAYHEIPKFPSIQLDVSIMIPRKNAAEHYTNAIAKTEHELIKDIQIIDEYEGDKIEKGQRSLTYSITYRSDKETLTDAQVTAIHQKVLENLKSQGANIRT